MGRRLLKFQLTPLQYNDGRALQEKDVVKLFAKGKNFPIKMGTEAGRDNANFELLKKYAKEFNHRIALAYGNWVAVDKSIAKPGSFKVGQVMVVPNTKLVGRLHHRAFPTLRFNHIDDRIGRIALAPVHYAPKGAKKGQPNYEANRLYAKKIQQFLANSTSKGALGFVGGDFNMNDRLLDWAFGENWTSMADKLKKWQNSGHGPIDGFATFDKEDRVKAKDFVVLDDSEFFMNGDHYVTRGSFWIKDRKV